jgi:hypothetical protein
LSWCRWQGKQQLEGCDCADSCVMMESWTCGGVHFEGGPCVWRISSTFLVSLASNCRDRENATVRDQPWMGRETRSAGLSTLEFLPPTKMAIAVVLSVVAALFDVYARSSAGPWPVTVQYLNCARRCHKATGSSMHLRTEADGQS